MSREAFERHQFDSELYFKLKEAEMEAKITGKRFSHFFVTSCRMNFMIWLYSGGGGVGGGVSKSYCKEPTPD